MKANRDITWVAIGVASICFITSIILYHSQETNNVDFWKGICIGVFSSSIVSIYLSIASYIHLRNAHFFRINVMCSNLKMHLSSHILTSDCANEIDALVIKKQANNYYKMTEITNDYHTFFPCGFKYDQVKRIHNLMLKMGDLSSAKFYAEYYPKEFKKAIDHANKFYSEHEAELDEIVEKYERYRTK